MDTTSGFTSLFVMPAVTVLALSLSGPAWASYEEECAGDVNQAACIAEHEAAALGYTSDNPGQSNENVNESGREEGNSKQCDCTGKVILCSVFPNVPCDSQDRSWSQEGRCGTGYFEGIYDSHGSHLEVTSDSCAAHWRRG